MTDLQAAQQYFDVLRDKFKRKKIDEAWIAMLEELFYSGWEMGYDAGVRTNNGVRERVVPNPGPPQRVRDL